MNTPKLAAYWKHAANEKWKTAESLMRTKRYADALFFCHLALEARLKAAVVQRTGEHAPLTHDLEQLARTGGLNTTQSQRRQLAEITAFNIRARYDDEKHSFYKKATRSYTQKYFLFTKSLLVWLEKME